MMPGKRAEVEVSHRISCAWAKFHTHKRWLLNPYVPVHLRLKLFDGVVSPCILYGLAVLPLAKSLLDRICITQRRMMRRIVGWRRQTTDTWRDTMSNIITRLERAQQRWSVESWSDRIAGRRWDVACQAVQLPPDSWTFQALHWQASLVGSAFRATGRPITRCDDTLRYFRKTRFSSDDWTRLFFQNRHECNRHAYIAHCK